MSQGSIDRRRGRRVDVQAPCWIRPLDTPVHERPSEQVTANVSLAGLYFESVQAGPWNVDDVVVASVAVPEAQRRIFPFTRLSGRCRVVRMQELRSPQPGAGQRFGVALEFGDNITALTATPTRG